MATISSNYYNFNSSMFGSSSSSSILGEYASIKNGSYKKLLSAYYKKQNGESTTGSSTNSSQVTDTEKSNLASTKNAADNLKNAANKLTATDSNSLFEKVAKKVTDEKTGVVTETTDYDRDKIASAVKDFVSSYNSTLESAAKTDTTNVLRKTAFMVSGTKANSNLLSKVGITIGTDNKLTVDDTKLKEASMTDLKTLFNGKGSYADRISSKASDIAGIATSAATTNRLYGANGKFSTSAFTGSMIDAFL